VGAAAAFATWTHQVPLDGVPRRAQLTRGSTVERRVTGVDVLGRLTAEDSSSTSAFTLAATTPTTSAQATTAAALTTAAQKYTLDARAGRVSTMVGTTTTAAFTRDVRDVVTQVSGVGVTNDARGGAAGRRHHDPGVRRAGRGEPHPGRAPEVRTLRRDALGRVVTETNQAGAVTSYGWDGAVRVLRKRSTGVIDVTVDKTGAGAAPDEHVAMLAVATSGTQTRTYPHLDRQGSVFAVSDAGGVVKEWWSYTAWGEPTVRNPAGTAVTVSPTLMPYGYHGAPARPGHAAGRHALPGLPAELGPLRVAGPARAGGWLEPICVRRRRGAVVPGPVGVAYEARRWQPRLDGRRREPERRALD
jgi:YD repeat-containing protein